MKTKLLWLGVAGFSLSVGLLAACHDDRDNASTPPPPTSVSDDTAQVLALAKQTSETSTAMRVNDGAFTINDTSETSAPITVNAM